MPALKVAVPPLPSVRRQSRFLKPKHAKFSTSCVSARPEAASAVVARSGAARGGCGAARGAALAVPWNACAELAHAKSAAHRRIMVS